MIHYNSLLFIAIMIVVLTRLRALSAFRPESNSFSQYQQQLTRSNTTINNNHNTNDDTNININAALSL